MIQGLTREGVEALRACAEAGTDVVRDVDTIAKAEAALRAVEEHVEAPWGRCASCREPLKGDDPKVPTHECWECFNRLTCPHCGGMRGRQPQAET